MRVWLNGSLVDGEAAGVSPFDRGLLTGDGVFETLKVSGGVAFALRRHLERLAGSAAGMGLSVPPVLTLRTAVESVIAANGLVDARLRITVTGGTAPLGTQRSGDGPELRPTVIVAGGPLPAWPAEGVDVAVVPWPRNERGALAGIKSTSYGENVVALSYARRAGASEAVFGNTVGDLCEGAGSNVFVALRGTGRLVTPPLSSGCLAGVTRALLLELGVADEARLPLSALAEADEAFLSSTTREVQPIASVDGNALAGPCPGPLTQAAAAAFATLPPDP